MEQGDEKKGKAPQNSRIGDENREIQKWNELQENDEERMGKKEKLLEEKRRHLAKLNVIDLEIERETRRMAEEQKRQADLAQKVEKEAQAEKAKPVADEAALLAQRLDTLRLKHLDERRKLENDVDRLRNQMETSLDQFYDRTDAVADLKLAQKDVRKAQTTIGRLSGREKALNEHVEALRLNLEDIDRRRDERRGKIDTFAAEQFQNLENRHGEEIERLKAPPSPENESETEDFREHTPDSPTPHAVNDNETLPEHDPGGPELDR